MEKETPKFTTVAIAGLFCFIFASLMILIKGQVFFSTSYNSSLFSLHGTLVCFGLILYSIGSKAIPAAELTLLITYRSSRWYLLGLATCLWNK